MASEGDGGCTGGGHVVGSPWDRRGCAAADPAGVKIKCKLH